MNRMCDYWNVAYLKTNYARRNQMLRSETNAALHKSNAKWKNGKLLPVKPECYVYAINGRDGNTLKWNSYCNGCLISEGTLRVRAAWVLKQEGWETSGSKKCWVVMGVVLKWLKSCYGIKLWES